MQPPLPYRYRAFGLDIASEIPIPELYPFGSPAADITICRGRVEDAFLDGMEADKVSHRYDAREFVLQAPGVGRYRCLEGRRITMEDDGSGAASRLHLLTLVLPAAVMQRGGMLLHASAIRMGDGVCLFAGESGAGKSTLAAELCRRGHAFFCDDICVVEAPAQGGVHAVASHPLMKLWKDTVSALQDPAYTTEQRLWPALEKYGQMRHDDFHTGPLPVRRLFVLQTAATEVGGYASHRLQGIDGFLTLSNSTYRRQFLIDRAAQERHLKMVSRLAGEVPTATLSRPPSGGSIGAFADFVEGLL